MASLPPSSSESDSNVSCMVSGDTTLYLSSAVGMVSVTSVTPAKVSTTDM